MSRRYKMNKSSSRRVFSRGANRTHIKNLNSSGSSYVMRGGIRL